MELTQYMELCLHGPLIASHPDLIEDVNRELLNFPRNVPESILIKNSSSIRTAFIEIFDKYIGEGATWNIRLNSETQEQILELYRRCDAQKIHYQSPRHSPSSLNVLPLSTNTLPPVRRHNTFKSLVDAVNVLMKEIANVLDSSFNVYRKTAVKYIHSLLSIH